MANQLNVNDQVVPVVAENDVIVDYVSPNLLADTPESEIVSFILLWFLNSNLFICFFSVVYFIR